LQTSVGVFNAGSILSRKTEESLITQKGATIMRIATFLAPNGVKKESLVNGAVLIIDALRFTSVVVTALAHGALGVVPVQDIETAKMVASEKSALLCGERGGIVIPGFDLGNSPLEYQENVRGKLIVSTTTNGTKASVLCADAKNAFAACFLNANAAARKLIDFESIVIVCSGEKDSVAIEDVCAAGAIIGAVSRIVSELDLDDASVIAKRIYEQSGGDVKSALKDVGHCKFLMDLNEQTRQDLEFCLRENIHDVLPQLINGMFVAL
jgi:2-phosphosulfolactate phosphatase